ncbi:MAG TPA: hypothetical protein VKB45_07690 [Gemmatimonadales bacterium]|nr:hypothetical protein [Gemmatimonadales bacterium]
MKPTHTFGLFFQDADPQKLRGSPIAHVYVKVSRQHAYAEDLRLITPDCATMDEMDTCIGKLIADLERVRAEARGKFARPHRSPKQPKK